MRARISLALALHNHQPVGNFGWVIGDVYEHSYEPLVAALERHPRHPPRPPLHGSPPRLAGRRATGIPRAASRRSSSAGRVELLGVATTNRSWRPCRRPTGSPSSGSWATRSSASVAAGPPAPGWPSGSGSRTCPWPSSTAAIAGRSSTTPISGPPRSTSPTCGARTRPTTRAACSRCSGPTRTCATGSRSGRSTMSSPTWPSTRHRIATSSAVMGDDGEKFGAWPDTYEHCWGKDGWVDRFFDALTANADWIDLVTPGEWIEREPPLGRVYVPTSSYFEMGEWALPAEEGLAFERAVAAAEAHDRPGGALDARRLLAQLPGEVPRDQRPPQADAPDVRPRSARMPAGPATTPRSGELMQGQSNDCYWHGRLRRDLHRPHAPRHVRAPDRGRGCRGHGRPGGGRSGRRDRPRRHGPRRPRRDPRHVARPDRRDRHGRGWRDRLVGHPRGPSRPGRRHAPASRGLSPAARSTARLRPSPRRAAGRRADGGRRVGRGREHPRGRPVPGAGPRRPAPVRRLRAPLRRSSTCSRRARRASPSPGPRPWSSAMRTPAPTTCVERTDSERSPAARRPARARARLSGSRSASRSPAIGVEPSLGLEVSVENRSQEPVRFDLAVEWALMLLGGGGNPAAYYEVGGERQAHDGAGESPEATLIRSGNTYIGTRPRHDVRPAGHRLVDADRDRLELGIRVRADLPGQRARGSLADGAGARRMPLGQRRPAGVDRQGSRRRQ